jgi:hypothetical protein
MYGAIMTRSTPHSAGIAVSSDLAPLPRRQLTTLGARALFIAILGMYALLAPSTRTHVDKDWSHLWLGGRMITAGHADRLYDAALQQAVYADADPEGRGPPVWRERNDILGCFNYPPPAALAYAALAWMPVGTAAVVHAYLTLALVVLIAWLLAGSLDPRPEWALVGVAILAYPPFFVTLSVGQNSVVSMLILVGAWRLCRAKRDLAAGLLLGLLICKPNWLFAVAWIPLIHHRWRLLFGLGVGIATVLLVTLISLGSGPFEDYATLFRRVSHLHELPDYALSLKYNALGLFRKWAGAGSTLGDVLGWASCACVVGITWIASRGAWRPETPRFATMMACSLMAALWVNPHLNHYDLTLSAACVVAMAVDWRTLGRAEQLTAVAIILLVYLAIPWDRSWSLSAALPVPSLAILALWGWFVHRLARPAAKPQPAAQALR